jgi:hypothetical protein
MLAMVLMATSAFAGVTAPTIQGNYIEARTCDVYTAACFANSEVGLTGGEAILAWGVTKGDFKGTDLAGLTVVAVVKSNKTFGDVPNSEMTTETVLYLDDKASVVQKEALIGLAKEMGKNLVKNVILVESTPITFDAGSCTKDECGTLTAGDTVAIETRCLHGDDKKCGNDTPFYNPLTKVDMAMPHFTIYEKYMGKDLGVTWKDAGRRGAYVGTFSR